MQPSPPPIREMDTDEKVLLQKVIHREPGAFEAFLDRYRSLIFSVFYGKGFAFPRDYMEDVYQSFVLALTRNDYHKLRAYQGRNNCSLATFLQIVATRFALDELRKWKRHPRGRGNVVTDDEEYELEVEDHRDIDPVSENLANEELDIFHNLLFGLEWKRISVVLWVFRAISRERVADVMDTSRANIDALYKRAKDQMTQRFAEGSYSRNSREADPEVLTPAVRDLLRPLLVVPSRQLQQALLQPAAKGRAILGLALLEYGHFRCSAAEIGRLAGKEPLQEVCESVLSELHQRVLP
jgi:RNA polymerase sigma factor (sigma-70 family)